jgi:hypothetical protein
MKKILGIIVLGLLLSFKAYAEKKIKPGSGPLKLTDDTVKIFHTYLTEKFIDKTFKTENLPGFHLGPIFCSPCKPTYGDYFLILSDGNPYIWQWGVKGMNRNPGMNPSIRPPANSKIFSKGNKILWKTSKKRISRKVTLEELKTILKEVGLYD